MKANRTYELGKRLLVTILILVIYMAGRSILLYCVDPAAYQLEELDTQNIMASMISGDRYQYTVFALGVMPYIMSSLLMWLYAAIRGSDYKSRISPRKMSQATLALMMVIASVSALSRAGDLVFQESALDVQVLRAIAVAEMVAGAAVIYGMASFNKERGIGGQMPIILVNIVDNLALTIQKSAPEQLKRPAALCLIMVIIILAMENVIIRIPVQRVSIHNDYAKDSYIPLKSDPIGVMPVMFAVSFLMILRFLVRLLLYIFEDSQRLQLFYNRLELTNAAGAGVYHCKCIRGEENEEIFEEEAAAAGHLQRACFLPDDGDVFDTGIKGRIVIRVGDAAVEGDDLDGDHTYAAAGDQGVLEV